MKYPLIVVGVLALAGCQTMGNLLETRKVDYKSASRLPPLEIPPDLTRPSTDDRFVVPDAAPSGSATFSAYAKERSARPAATSTDLLPKIENVRVERAGTQRWLVAQGAPDDLWPIVKDFWQELGFIVNVEVREAGVMETDWAEKRARIDDGALRNLLSQVLGSTSTNAERDKFRTRLEPGGSGKTTEIFISHRGLVEVAESRSADARIIWQPRPADPELEAEMLRRLMVRLGVQEARAKAGIEQASTAPRARISRGKDGSGLLAIDDQFDRAWRRVGLALDRVGFTVEDRDRSKGVYFVRYVDPDADAQTKKPDGLLSKLAFWRSSPDPKAKSPQYRIAVKNVDPGGSEINVLNNDGQLDRTDTGHRILSLLYEQLK